VSPLGGGEACLWAFGRAFDEHNGFGVFARRARRVSGQGEREEGGARGKEWGELVVVVVRIGVRVRVGVCVCLARARLPLAARALQGKGHRCWPLLVTL